MALQMLFFGSLFHQISQRDLGVLKIKLLFYYNSWPKNWIDIINLLNLWRNMRFFVWNIPITDKFTIVFLVGASVKSTLHLYWPASDPLTLCTRRIAGNASGLNCARGPSHFSSDHTSDVARDRPPPPLPIKPGFPTSILKVIEMF